MKSMTEKVHLPYRRTLWISAAIQGILLFVSTTSMDMGEMLTSFAYAGAAYWIGAVLIVRRRTMGPTRGDRLFLSFGLPVLSLLSLVVSPFIWAFRGKW